MKAICSTLLFCVSITLFAQKAAYAPATPKYRINGAEVLYKGYIINRDGARAYT